MIYIDSRAGSGMGVGDLYPYIKKIGAPCEKRILPAGDAAFEANSLNGPIWIGVERKTIADMLTCIDDSRFSAGQKLAMYDHFDICVLCIEGMWEPGIPPNQGWMYQAYRDKHEGPGYHRKDHWAMALSAAKQRVLYSKLYRYLISLSMSPKLKITYSYDLWGTAYNITEWYQWGLKTRHTSQMETQLVVVPEMTGRASLARKWAHALDGIGNVWSDEAGKMFRTGHALANAEESDWMRIDGISFSKARRIIQQVRGYETE